MKRIVLPVVLALACSSGWAQEKKPAPKKPEAAKEAAKEGAAAKKSRRTEDARACLEKSTNNEIIQCAEAYL